MSINMVDMSGKPRGDDELDEAIEAVGVTMARDLLKVPPRLAVLMPAVLGFLRELKMVRGFIRKAREEKEGQPRDASAREGSNG